MFLLYSYHMFYSCLNVMHYYYLWLNDIVYD